MLDFIKVKLSEERFNKLLLAFIFVGTLVLIVHLEHKQAAGTDEGQFIVWAEAQAAVVLTKMITMMTADMKTTKLTDTTEPPDTKA